MINVREVKEVKRSDSLWRFACGDVYFWGLLKDCCVHCLHIWKWHKRDRLWIWNMNNLSKFSPQSLWSPGKLQCVCGLRCGQVFPFETRQECETQVSPFENQFMFSLLKPTFETHYWNFMPQIMVSLEPECDIPVPGIFHFLVVSEKIRTRKVSEPVSEKFGTVTYLSRQNLGILKIYNGYRYREFFIFLVVSEKFDIRTGFHRQNLGILKIYNVCW